MSEQKFKESIDGKRLKASIGVSFVGLAVMSVFLLMVVCCLIGGFAKASMAAGILTMMTAIVAIVWALCLALTIYWIVTFSNLKKEAQKAEVYKVQFGEPIDRKIAGSNGMSVRNKYAVNIERNGAPLHLEAGWYSDGFALTNSLVEVAYFPKSQRLIVIGRVENA